MKLMISHNWRIMIRKINIMIKLCYIFFLHIIIEETNRNGSRNEPTVNNEEVIRGLEDRLKELDRR